MDISFRIAFGNNRISVVPRSCGFTAVTQLLQRFAVEHEDPGLVLATAALIIIFLMEAKLAKRPCAETSTRAKDRELVIIQHAS